MLFNGQKWLQKFEAKEALGYTDLDGREFAKLDLREEVPL